MAGSEIKKTCTGFWLRCLDSLGPKQIGWLNYFFLTVCVVAQAITLWISWPSWQARPLLADTIPNLPWIAGTSQFSTGILLLISLVLVLISPRKLGMLIHLTFLGIAIAMDQIRCQPQVFSVAFLMAACVWPDARRICVWYLIAMWTWAGIHKFLSPDWFGLVCCHMFTDAQNRLADLGIKTSFDPTKYFQIFAAIIAFAEVATGLLAWLRPKLGAIACVLLHLGITSFLILLDWNFSVLPWNLATAIVGAWLIWSSAGQTDDNGIKDQDRLCRQTLPRSVWEKAVLALLLVVPIGFYFGFVRHGLAHVLYSSNLPICVINRSEKVELVDSWDELKFPFPKVEKSYLDYFKLTCQPNDTIHIRNQLSWLTKDQFFRHQGDQQIIKITKREFLDDQASRFHVSVADDPRGIFQLELAGVLMKRRSKFDVVFAIEFDPAKFKPHQLQLLAGIPNVEQIQLRGCEIADEDLSLIPTLRKLWGIGLEKTAITDEGFLFLEKQKLLHIVEYEGSAISESGHRKFVESQTGEKVSD